MKHLRKIMLLIFALMLAIAPVNVQASTSFGYESEATVLNSLGLYNGISETSFDPDLGAALDRETGIVMLLRVFGLESAALDLTDAEVNTALAGFSDAQSISSWAKNSVAYAVSNGLVNGLPDGTFGPKDNLNGRAYCTLILRQLGYTPDYDSAAAQLAEAGGLTPNQATFFSGKDLIKDDLVGITFGVLSAQDTDGATIIQNLVEGGVINGQDAIAAGIVESLSPLEEAQAAVAAYEAAPLTTLSEIAAAEALRLKAVELLALVTDAEAKAALEVKVSAQKTKSDTAKAGLTPRNRTDRGSHDNEDSNLSVAITGLSSSQIYINGYYDDYMLPFSVLPTDSVVEAVYGNNTPFGDSLRSKESEPGSYYLYFGGFEDGTYTIAISATKSGYDQVTSTKQVIVDSTPPVISAPENQTSATFTLTSNENGTYYYLVYPASEYAPDSYTIKAQEADVIKGTGTATTSGSGNQITVTGLTESLSYRLYLIVEDAAGNISPVHGMSIMIFGSNE